MPASRSAQRALQAKLFELESRALEVYPRRRDTPLRYLNITDGEVREVELIARKYRMSELLNISPVVTGCPCEEGEACTDQVYVVGTVGEQTVGLQLSRRKNRWGMGVVQKRWLEHAALKAREGIMDFRSYQEARSRLLLEFPMCAPTLVDTKTAQVSEAPPAK